MSRSLLYDHPLPSPDDYLFETLEDYSSSSSLLDFSMDLFSPDDDYIYGDDDNYLYSGGDDLLDRLPLDDDDDDWRSLDDLALGGAAAPSEPPDLGGPSLDLVLGIGGASSESPDVDLDLDLNLDAASLEEGDAADSPPTLIDATAAVEDLLWEEELDDLPLEEAAFDLAHRDAEPDAHAWDVLVALEEIDGEMQELFFGAEEDGLGIGELGVGDEPSTSGRAPTARLVVEGLPSVVVAEGEGEGEGERVVCAICKEEVAAGETVKRLPCSHGYHEECIVPWLTMCNTCPVCRHTLPTEEDVWLRGRRSNRRGGHLVGFEEDFML